MDDIGDEHVKGGHGLHTRAASSINQMMAFMTTSKSS